uniref:Uncharacterized protein n=1 Tax=Candidatus Kentrum sp. DK TaxID=2126562 RepID=A0A450SID4_9GAMM|nr:MAG: hypothetical protein BECKDK2373C_GA0170839_102027 [Candidatus Kentron sp. DK]VFJ53097.1 MAG: hypothetical protein BECKDK2373B_GA0170837_10411 [Candidatus Kentron sp. DK]
MATITARSQASFYETADALSSVGVLSRLPDRFEKEELAGVFPPSEEEELHLSPRLKEEIDRDIAISRAQIRSGQCKKLDDGFMRGFLEEAHRRNADIFKKND